MEGMCIDIAEHEKWFEEYARDFIEMPGTDNAPLKLKLEHSRKVLENASKIIEHEKYPRDFKRCILLSALYHDIARFTQFIRHGTFCDDVSFDHGREGVRILLKTGRLAGEQRENRHLVLGAIALHNRFSLPVGLSGKKLVIAQILRDADKLDILRILDEHLAHKPVNPTVVRDLPESDDLSGPGVREAVLLGKSASYNDLRSVNDFRLLLGTWLFSMSSMGSRNILLKAGHARHVVEGLPDNYVFGDVRRALLSRYDAMERAVK